MQDQKSSPIERAIKKFGGYFEERGLGAKELPAAIIVHELLGMIMASAAWTACYHIQPSQRLGNRFVKSFKGDTQVRMQQAYNTAMIQATNFVSKTSWLKNQSNNLPRLTTSLAESLCFRAAAKPATFVFKLWASFHIVRLAKERFSGEILRNLLEMRRRDGEFS